MTKKSRQDSNKIKDDQLQQEVYEAQNFPWIKIVLLSICLLFGGFLLNFSIDQIVKDTIDSAIAANRSCPITYNSLSINFLPPRVSIGDLSISGNCLNQPGRELKLGEVDIKLSSPSFYPPGLKFHTLITKGSTVLNIYPTVSFLSHVVKIEESIITEDILTDLFGTSPLKGSIALNGLFFISNMDIKEGAFQLKSKDLLIPGQTIQNFSIPSLPLGNLSVKATYASGRLSIDEFIVGMQGSPILAEIKAKIKINRYNIGFSKLEANGEFSLSKSFIDTFPIINLLLSGKQPTNGFYKVEMNGTLGAPNPQIK